MKVKISDLHLEGPNAAVAVENIARGRGPRTESNPLTTVLPDGRRIVLDGHHRIVKALLNAGSDPDTEIEVDHADAPGEEFGNYAEKDWRSLSGGLTSPQLLRGTIREVAKKLVAKHAPAKLARKRDPLKPRNHSDDVRALLDRLDAEHRAHSLEVHAAYRAGEPFTAQQTPAALGLADKFDEIHGSEHPFSVVLRAGVPRYAAAWEHAGTRSDLMGDLARSLTSQRPAKWASRPGLSLHRVRIAREEFPAVRLVLHRPATHGAIETVHYMKSADELHDFIDRHIPEKDKAKWREAAAARGWHRTEPTKLARIKAPAGGAISGGGTSTGGIAAGGGQFAAKPRLTIREAVLAFYRKRKGAKKLAKKKSKVEATTTRTTHDELLSEAVRGLRRGDHLPLAVLADHMQENGIPGAHVLRHAAAQKNHPALGVASSGSPLVVRPGPRMTAIFRRLRAGGATLHLHTMASDVVPFSVGEANHLDVPPVLVRSRKHLVELMQDWSPGSRAAMWGEVARHLPRDHPDDDQPLRLAKKKPVDVEHLRPNAPLAPTDPLPLDPETEVHSVTRETRARNEPKSVGPSEDAQKLRTRSLSVGEVKQIEDAMGLPEGHAGRLTVFHRQVRKALKDGRTDVRLGDKEGDIPVSLDQATRFLQAAAAHRMKGLDAKGKGGKKVRQTLQNANIAAPARLAYMIAHLGHEAKLAAKLFEGGEGAKSWYGDHVAVMARHLRDSFGGDDPEMWGTVDEKTGRIKLDPKGKQPPGLTLAKLLVAATSGGEKPDRNYAVAHAMISKAHENANGDPNWFAHLPTHQDDALNDWIDAARSWHATHPDGDKALTDDELLTPGTSINDRAKWWARVVKPLPRELGGNRTAENAVGELAPTSGYGYMTARVRMINDPANPHHNKVLWVEKGSNADDWRTPYPIERSRRKRIGDKASGKVSPKDAYDRDDSPDADPDFSSRHNGTKQIQANLPITDSNGQLQSKLFSARGATVNKHIKLLRAVIDSFVRESANTREGIARAADFFTRPLSKREIVERTKKIAEIDRTSATRIARGLADNRGMFFEDDKLPGAFILGPKFGAFSQNLHLDVPHGKEWDAWRTRYGAHLTADLWWSRTWNRLLGTMFEGGGRVETPRGGKSAKHPERKIMRKAAHEALKVAADELGLSNVAELQAALWYSEQQLYRMFGVKSDSRSYLDGVRVVTGRAGQPDRYTLLPDGRINDAEQGTADAGRKSASREAPRATGAKADGGG